MVSPWTVASAPPRPARGFWLTSTTLLSMISNLCAAGYYFVMSAAPTRTDLDIDAAPDANTKLEHKLLFISLLCVLNVVFLVGIWMWKKWGVYGYVGFSLFAALAGLSARSNSVLGTLISTGFLLLVYVPRWKHFE